MSTPRPDQTLVGNLVCPRCLGPVHTEPKYGSFTGILKDGGSWEKHVFHDEAVPMLCLSNQCEVKTFYMGFRFSQEDLAAAQAAAQDPLPMEHK